MGIHMDTLEDNRERWDQIAFDLVIQKPSPPKAKPLFECSLCSFKCNSRIALERHVRQIHGGQYVYVRANGRIAQELHYFSEPLAALECVNIGHDNVTVEVRTKTKSKTVPVVDREQLESLLPASFKGEVEVLTYTDSRPRARYLLYFAEKLQLDSRTLDKHVFELQLALERGEIPDWRSYELARDDLERTLFERDYMNGFYEYSLAFHHEKSGDAGSGKFEKAMTLLSRFNTRFARTARYVLSIRNNLFRTLEDCPKDSPFYLCRAFFLEGVLDLPKRTRGRSESDTGIYVDGFTERIIQIVRAFYARDFKNLEADMAILGQLGMTADPNNEHKFHLLQARTFRVKENQVMAKKYYQQLSSHPLFGAEAREFIS